MISLKTQGAFVGCPHHDDDYEACIQYSGTAPCGVEEEGDTALKEIESLKDRMQLLREEVSRRDEQVRNMSGEVRWLRSELEQAREAQEWVRMR